jgi:threonine synthase
MASVVLIPAGLERGKVAATQIYGGTVIEVDGSYDDVNRICAELASERQWAVVNVNLRPYYAEGSKTLAFEIVEQLGWRPPQVVVCPMASGALLTKVAKGLRELHQVGLLDEVPTTKLCGAQAEGCAPIVTAFEQGSTDVHPVKPNTIAKSLAIGNPADGPYALEEVRSSVGSMVAVPEEEVAGGIRLLARTEGIFTETAGGVTISALERLVRTGAISTDEEVVVLLTGTGLKTLEAVHPGEPTVQVSRHFDEVSQQLEGIGL